MNFEHWRKRPEIKEYGWSLEAGKEKEINSPYSLQKKHQPAGL